MLTIKCITYQSGLPRFGSGVAGGVDGVAGGMGAGAAGGVAGGVDGVAGGMGAGAAGGGANSPYCAFIRSVSCLPSAGFIFA